MCVGFWSLEHPEYALILCSNRDEFLARPTARAHFHSFEPGPPPEGGSENTGSVLSGRDLRAGGTWLGISRAGRVAFLTNITEDYKTYASTRGELASSFLLPSDRHESLDAHVAALAARNTAYAGFNLLLLAPRVATHGQHERWWAYDAAYVTNHGGGGALAHRALSAEERRCGGLSNGVDGRGAEGWPKVRTGSALFHETMQGVAPGTPDEEIAERLFSLLSWKSAEPPRARSELRNTIQIEPLRVPIAVEAGEAGPLYGTRLSTVVLVRRDGSAVFFERDVWGVDELGQVQRGDPRDTRVFRFALDPPREGGGGGGGSST